MNQFWAYLSLFFAGLYLSPILAQDVALQPQQAAILLKNEQVLQGKVTRIGQQYHLSLGDAGEIRIPVADVLTLAQSLEELYEIRVKQIPPNSVDAHLKLAEWSIRQKLFPQAAEQLVAAMSLKPNDARITRLEQRLKAASEPVVEKNTSSFHAIGTVSHEQLEKVTQDLPPGTMEKFTVVIQPILMAKCGAATCHGGSETQLQLLQPVLGRVPTKRFTQRNLYSVLSVMDRDQPLESELLKKALEAHGGTKTAPFVNDKDRQYLKLLEWIGGSNRPIYDKNVVPASVNSERFETPQRQAPAILPTSEESASRPVRLPTIDTPTNSTRDPFDPQLFNKQFFSNPQ